MHYQRGYPNTSSQRLTNTQNRAHISIHTLNPAEAKYYKNQKDETSREDSPHSSHSINTPVKPFSTSTSYQRPNSKESLTNKVESSSNYSKFSSKYNNDVVNMNIPLEKSVNFEANKGPINSQKLPMRYGESEEEKFANPYNFKKKEESAYSGFQESQPLKKGSSEIKKEVYPPGKCKAPYQPKYQVKREMTGLRNIGNTCFLNSTLQCLFNTPQFSDFFLEGEFMNQINNKNEKGVAEEFAKLLKRVRGAKGYSAESTYSLKSALSS